MPACGECNRGTSDADLVAGVIARWNYFNSAQASADHARLVARVRKNLPALREEWINSAPDERLKARQHLEQQGVQVPPDAQIALVGPVTIRVLNLFAHKVVLALYFEHFKRGLPADGGIYARWNTKEDFSKNGIPKTLLKMMSRYGVLEQGKWNTREEFEYRYETNDSDDIFMCFASFRGSLFTLGFATGDIAGIPAEAGNDWLKPVDLLSILTNPRYEDRL